MKDARESLCRILIDRCKTEQLERITVTSLLREAGLSRKTFYNHFRDKDDLIRYTYTIYIRSQWQRQYASTSMFEGCITYYRTMLEYRDFVTQALSLKTQNSLMEEMCANSSTWLAQMYRTFYGEDVPPAVSHAIHYNSYGQTALNREWALNGMKISPEKMAEYSFRCVPAIVREIMDKVDEVTQQNAAGMSVSAEGGVRVGN